MENREDKVRENLSFFSKKVAIGNNKMANRNPNIKGSRISLARITSQILRLPMTMFADKYCLKIR